MGHRILLNAVIIDVPSGDLDAARRFWATALAATARPGNSYPEYTVLKHAAATVQVAIQDVGDTGSRVHLDIESDDVEAEVRRLVRAGARQVSRHGDWVVLRAPDGQPVCVVPASGEAFDRYAVTVDD